MTAAASGTIDLGGKPIHRLGYGAMRLAGPGIWGPPRDLDAALRVLRRAVDLGVTFIDTADAYGPHLNEEIIHRALHDGTGYGDVVIATKGGLTRSGPPPQPWQPLGRPEYLRQCVQLSLRRLGVERLGLWQLHRIDPNTPREDQFGVMKSFLDEGLVEQIGLSEVTVEDVQAAQAAGIPVASVQNRYNVADRNSQALLDFCTAQRIAFIPWAPINKTADLQEPDGPMARVAAAHPGSSRNQIALAWLLHHSPMIVPIPGTSSLGHLEENMAAADLKLTEEEVEAITGLQIANPTPWQTPQRSEPAV